jgi:fused signal recognition particle receptor
MGLFTSAFSKLKQGLTRTRDGVMNQVRGLLLGGTLSDDLLKELESKLIQADIGVQAGSEFVKDIQVAWKAGQIKNGDEAIVFLKSRIRSTWDTQELGLHLAPPGQGPTVILIAGVNGAGKTTSVAKIAKSLRDQNKTVMLAAGDTFRAAAVEQLETWAKRLGVEIIKGKQGGDPAAVAFDACQAALSRNIDVLLVDTAGRLHTQNHLIRQLIKVRDVCAKKIPNAPHEALLVLDATTGQNAITQAKIFTDAINVTGIFLAKLDGTAKGGIVVAIQRQLGIPVKLVGIGETPDDVEPFDPGKFIDALFATD